MSNQSVSLSLSGEGKNMVVAYLLWFFIGWFGVHRFYLGKISSGVAQLLLLVIGWITTLIFVGWLLLIPLFVWWALDAYFVQLYVTEYNAQIGVNSSSITLNKSGSISDDLDQLEKLHSLKEKGVITEKEYQQRKAQIMG